MFGRATHNQRIGYQILATLICIPFVLPVVAIVGTSFSGEGAAANYSTVIKDTPLLSSLLNSIVVSLATVVAVYVLTMLAGYAFAKLTFAGRKLLLLSFLVGLTLPAIALIVPLFNTIQRLGLFNNYLAVILPLTAIITPFTLFLVYNYMRAIPNEILEAAHLDGCTPFRSLILVVLPMSGPISAVVVVWTFLASWNEFFLPLLFFQESSMQTLTQLPAYFTTEYGSDVPKIFAALVLISIPVAISYLVSQNYFESGLSAGGLK